MFFENLKENYEKLSIAEQQVVDYLMKRPLVEKTTLKDIKHDVMVSSSTVIRAANKLGYRTFTDLRYDIRLNKEIEKKQEAATATSFAQMKEQIGVEFERTISILEQSDFDLFSDILVNSRRIFCVGIGSSYMVASDFNRKLKLMNLWSNDYFENFSIQRIPDISTKDDAIIVFSLGGDNEELNEIVLKAKNKGTTILTVTSLSTNPLAKISDHIIRIYNAPKKREKIRSRLMLNLVANLLFETIANKLS